MSYIDSSGLGHLVSALTRVHRQGGGLKLLDFTKKAHDLVQITRLYTVFDIMDDEEGTVRFFAQPHAASA